MHRMHGERRIVTIFRQLGLRATRLQTATPSSRRFSQLARRKDGLLQSSQYSETALPVTTRRQMPLSWPSIRRYSSPSAPSTTIPTSTDLNPTSDSKAPPAERPPSYEITFTCKPCSHRSTHTISKQGYHYGTVLITCGQCKNRHVISDHLGIFADQAFTVEDLMRQNGSLVKRGTLSGKGDVEFWDDGTKTERAKDVETSGDRSTS